MLIGAFWTNSINLYKINKKDDFFEIEYQKSGNDQDVILGQYINMDGWTKMKILKHGLKIIFYLSQNIF